MRLLYAAAVALLLASCGTPADTIGSFRASPSASAAASPTASPTMSPVMLPATEAWSRVRAAMPASVSVPMPTWLPDGLEQRVQLANVTVTPPGYELTYLRGDEPALRFTAGGQPFMPMEPGSGIGTAVRGARAVLSFPSDLFQHPGGRGLRRVRWTEGDVNHAVVYSIESDVLTGETLLHVAWSMDRTGVSRPFARTAVGSCASKVSPEETVRNWVLALGRQSPDTILDCFADDYCIGGIGFATLTADDLPTATVDRVSLAGPIADRQYVGVTWTFTRDPGSGWVQGQHGSLFYMIGLDGDRYRIFEGGTGAYGPPP